MAVIYSGYDPDELRRRQLLAPDQVQGPADTSAIMAPDEADDQDNVGPPDSTKPKFSPAQENYQGVVNQMPSPAQYQPSKWRRFGAAVAGGLAGVRNPEMGYQLGHQIASEPYNAAMGAWRNRITQAAENVDIDKQAQGQEIARQRAGAYAESAHARTKAANATEEWRKHEALKWSPTTREEQEAMLKLQHPAPAPPRPTAFEEYLNDPQGYSKYLQEVNKGKVQPLTFAQRQQLIDRAQVGPDARNAANIAARRTPTPAIASPGDQEKAEHQAIESLLRTNPEYAPYIEMGGTTTNSAGVTHTKLHRVKGANELPQEGQSRGFLKGSVTHSEASLARDRYTQFLTELDKHKKRILGTSKSGVSTPGSNSDWIIEENQ